MNFLESKLAQIVALGGLIATIAGFGYTGAGYVQRIEALESQTAISYEEDINAIKADILIIQEKLQKLDLIDGLQKDINKNNNDLAILKEQYMNSKKDFEKQIQSLESQLEKNKNPLSG